MSVGAVRVPGASGGGSGEFKLFVTPFSSYPQVWFALGLNLGCGHFACQFPRSLVLGSFIWCILSTIGAGVSGPLQPLAP